MDQRLVGWAKRSVPTGWTAVKPVGTLRFAHPTVAAKLAHATFREPTKSQVISWASLYVGWAKRSVPTGWTAVKPVGTLRFAHPTDGGQVGARDIPRADEITGHFVGEPVRRVG